MAFICLFIAHLKFVTNVFTNPNGFKNFAIVYYIFKQHFISRTFLVFTVDFFPGMIEMKDEM